MCIRDSASALCVGAMVLLRALFDHLRTVQANRCSAQVQQTLRARLYDRIVSLGPAWFANQRTGGVMLTVVDGVEQLQTFFGQYLPQVAIAAAAPFAIFAVIAFWDVPTALVFLVAALFALFGPMAVHLSLIHILVTTDTGKNRDFRENTNARRRRKAPSARTVLLLSLIHIFGSRDS